MTRGRRLLLVVACVACLLAVAVALPSADPRIDVLGSDESTETALTDDNGTLVDGDARTGGDTGTGGEPGGGDDELDLDVEFDGSLVPGTEREVRVLDSGRQVDESVAVDGTREGTGGNATFTVPYDEAIRVTTPSGLNRTAQVETDATIEALGPLVPGMSVDLRATVGGEPIPDGEVRVDGEHAGTTNSSGVVTVEPPDGADNATMAVERGAVSGEATVGLASLDVEFSSFVLPGMPASVAVTADGTPLEDATVAVGDDTATTDSGGQAGVRLPVSDEVTVTATAGSEQATATASGLYWRLATLVLVPPSLVIGAVFGFLRFTTAQTRKSYVSAARQRQKSVLLGFGGLLSRLVSAVPRRGSISLPRIGPLVPSLPRPGSLRPSLSGLSLPSSPSAPQLRSLVPSLSVPGLSGGVDRVTSAVSSGEGGTATDPDDTGEPEADTGAAATDLTPEERVGRHWHRFVAHLGIEQPERWTPGQVARRAFTAGLPRRQVRTLVETFRAVEYGGRPATPDRVERARETSDSLQRQEPDEGQEGDA